ncbi:hypothetical protein NBRC3280_3459 [Acetobacter pasteurianus NBRC 3280]|uniref:Uncharacterized protein n=1 Tax=Acetobacter pasteurianus NBRC 3278 TaxID=1226660 RepID=A0A401X9F9_ACEPA|nr:hypothetical protein NBRC3278_3460 [Acetobacter pasteurianus NBRC 3278]GCD70824.1 hypothetical protein NBRC3280_3459 [Acetobacter pasteurianus NBRC 3280]GCD73674.1 hypothetical protein NBRC3284_2830 [Acetobacter pasteurianus NBRC 3284]
MNPASGSSDAGASDFRCHAGFCHLAASGAGYRLERNGRCRRGPGGWCDPLARHSCRLAHRLGRNLYLHRADRHLAVAG